MNVETRDFIWNQFGAAIDTLESAIRECPEDKWFDASKGHEMWHLASHTLFWLDYYLSDSHENFKPPAPFDLIELDPSGKKPDRAYSQDELLTYLEQCRKKCRETIAGMTDDKPMGHYNFRTVTMSYAELLLYNMRHVQHHAAQMNLLLRQRIGKAPKWVGRSRT